MGVTTAGAVLWNILPAANPLTRGEARRIAANIAKPSELLSAEPRPDANARIHRRLTWQLEGREFVGLVRLIMTG
jgi:hypothetical protein